MGHAATAGSPTPPRGSRDDKSKRQDPSEVRCNKTTQPWHRKDAEKRTTPHTMYKIRKRTATQTTISTKQK